MTLDIRQLGPDNLSTMEALSMMFGEAFAESDMYAANRPSRSYLKALLSGDSFIALAAVKQHTVVGGIAAYELKKYEAERSEIYLYDLAVDAAHRREGIATALIERLKQIATQRGAHTIFVQADTNAEDAPAIALYSKLGRPENVLHFDIAIRERNDPT